MMLSVNIKKRLGRHPRADEPRRASWFGQRQGEEEGFCLDVEFEALPGVTILFGASGSGKTTTLKAIAGILRPDAGRIAIGEKTLFDSAHAIDLPIRQRGVGYVFQNLALFPRSEER